MRKKIQDLWQEVALKIGDENAEYEVVVWAEGGAKKKQVINFRFDDRFRQLVITTGKNVDG